MPFEASRPTTSSSPRSATRCAASSRSGYATSHYLPMYCVPALHHPVTARRPTRPSVSARRSRSSAAATPIASASCGSCADYPLRVWGGGWTQRRGSGGTQRDGRAAGVRLRQALRVRGLDAVAEPSSSDERHRRREHARPSSWPRPAPARWWTSRRICPTLFKPGEEVLGYRDLGELTPPLDFYLARPTRPAPSVRTRAAARWRSTRCATASRRCCA